MDDRDFEQRLAQLMKQDFSVGTEEFRDALLDKCLAVLNADDEGAVIDDDALELLAAAGDKFARNQDGLV